MLIPEVVVVFKFFLGEYFEEFGIDGVGIAEGLKSRERGEVVEIEMSIRQEGNLKSAEGEVLCFSRGDLARIFGVKGSESFENVLVGLS